MESKDYKLNLAAVDVYYKNSNYGEGVTEIVRKAVDNFMNECVTGQQLRMLDELGLLTVFADIPVTMIDEELGTKTVASVDDSFTKALKVSVEPKVKEDWSIILQTRLADKDFNKTWVRLNDATLSLRAGESCAFPKGVATFAVVNEAMKLMWEGQRNYITQDLGRTVKITRLN